MVDDLSVKYTNKVDVKYLNVAPSSLYKITFYWKGELYLVSIRLPESHGLGVDSITEYR